MAKRKDRIQYNNRKNILKDFCLVCGTTEKLERHRIEVGGPYIQENVAILCRKHHMQIHYLMWRNRKVKDKTFDTLLCKAREIFESEGKDNA